MAQQQSPFLEAAYGWNFGEGGWNAGMDQNLLKFSFLFDANVDGVVGSLPSAVNGQAYFLTTDNRLYFAVGTTWFSSPTPKWFQFKNRSTGDTYQFSGTAANLIDSPAQLDTRLDAIELTVASLGTAAFEDISAFATAAELDIVGAQSQTYTDSLRQDMANDTDPAKGSSLVGYAGNDIGSVPLALSGVLDNRNAYPFQFGAAGDGVTDDTAAWLAAIATGKLVDGLGKTYLVTTLPVPSDRWIIRANFVLPAGSTTSVPVIKVDGNTVAKKNIVFWGVHINGNRQNRTSVDGPGDGDLSGFSILGVVDNLLIRDCSADYCGTDGLALFGAGAGVSLSLTNITVENFTANFNRRHGVSLDSAKGVKFVGGKWNSNGLDLDVVSPLDSGMRGARYGGDLYGNGIDVESYGATAEYSTHVEDVSFYDVECIKNYGPGMLLLPSPDGYALPLWRPFINISVYGGHFDQGIAPASSERSSIQVSSVGGFAAGQVAVDGFNVFGARLENGIGMNYARGANINAYVAFPNGGAFTYHAFVQNCIRAHLNLITPQTQLIYQDQSTLTFTQQPSAPGVPTIIAGDANAQVNSQTATLVSASEDGGYLYRILASVQLIGGSATVATSFVLAGPRTIMDAHASAISTSDGSVIPFHFNPGALTLGMKPGTFAELTMVVHVTVK